MGAVCVIPDLSVIKRNKVARFVHAQSSGWRESSSHPSIIQIIHIEKDRGMFYLVCHFIDLSDLESFHGSIWESDHRICLEIGDRNGRKKETGRWLDKLTVTFKADHWILCCQLAAARGFPWVWVATVPSCNGPWCLTQLVLKPVRSTNICSTGKSLRWPLLFFFSCENSVQFYCTLIALALASLTVASCMSSLSSPEAF